MAKGNVVENRLTLEILEHPRHEETKKLVASARATELKLTLKAGTSG